ncbi:cell wall-binding repeat-containing protein [Kineococcus rhizosphaerae]|uniref:Putative cell wall-binding protein n=1 Tax=Kineococcus rhizosphaerae TaxID=559628 RepID=A0A2T0R2D7_9ACTN|nr:cell wall-binding repeat-containing protein [Kineococcus rhizosphaerae]PRY13935.1 putative cell wall-binding protein [Kineococcus rhizosphaerae]
MTSRSPRLRALAAAFVLTSLTAAGSVLPAAASTGFQPDAPDRRIGGVDRFDTAARTALDAFPDGASTAILANGWRNIDALSGAYLAGLEKAPILLTDRDTVPASTLAALRALGVEDVVVLGDENSVGDAALDQLDAAGIGVADVVAGEDRYDTAVQIYGFGETAPRTVFIARGDVPTGTVAADALAAGPAAFNGRPILLTAADRLPDVVADALDAVQPENVVFLGRGISQDVHDEVADLVPGARIQTIGGADRTETAAMLARSTSPDVLYEWRGQVAVANGYTVDALGAGVWAGLRHAPILLTDGTASLGSGTAEYLTSTGMTRGTVFGDERSVPQALAVRARELAHGGPAAPQAVTSVDVAGGKLFVGGREGDLHPGDTYVVDERQATRQELIAAAHAGSRIVAEWEIPRPGTVTWTLLTTRPEDWTDGQIERFTGGFALVDPVTGLRLRTFTDADLPAGGTYTVDGTSSTRSGLLADLNTDDRVRVTGTTFALTNVAFGGVVVGVDATGYTARGYGDTAAYRYPLPGPADDVRQAGTAMSAAQFAQQLTVGDAVQDQTVGGVRRLDLTNYAPQPFTSVYESGTLPTADPGTGALSTFRGHATDTGAPQTWSLGWGCRIHVDGSLATAEQFNAAVRPGAIVYVQPTDVPTGTAGDVWLTTAP